MEDPVTRTTTVRISGPIPALVVALAAWAVPAAAAQGAPGVAQAATSPPALDDVPADEVGLPAELPSGGAETFVSLSYHDVRDDVEAEVDADAYALSTERLIEQFEWLRVNGYTPVSVDDLLAAREGERPLPDGAVLLTFDDGLRSVYTRVFPLLKLFEYPAVVAPVGAWLDAPADWSMEYDGIGRVTSEDLVSWDELREMQASGLVEVATHSYDLHRGVPANPFGNDQPAAVTRAYHPETGGYESEPEYRARVRRDLETAVRRHEEELGRPPRVVVWPYGEYSEVTNGIADSLGLTVSLGLHSEDHPVHDLHGVGRYVVEGNPALPDLVWHLEQYGSAEEPIRVAHVDLDYVYDEDAEQLATNLDALVERMYRLRVSTVYLQAYADPDGDGTASSLYFPNRHLPVRADLFNRVSWQLRTRAGVEVFAWLPVLAYDLPDAELNDELSVKRWEDGALVPSRPDYRRLSPYEPRAREIVLEIYEDLARNAPLDGLVFHDDAYLNDREDATLHGDGRLPSAREKTRTLVDFTHELAERVRVHRPRAQTARNLYARVVLEPEAEEWFAQSLPAFLESYDHTALMAMPLMEGASDPERWLERLADRVAEHPDGLSGTVFELQSVDWRTGEPVPATRLAEWMRLLQRRGAVHLGYYPDDFVLGRPDLDTLRAAVSVERYPFRRR